MSLFQRAAHAVIRANESNLPPPSAGLRTFDYNETLVMFRNRDQYMPTQSPSVSPPKHRAVDCTQSESCPCEACQYQLGEMQAAWFDSQFTGV